MRIKLGLLLVLHCLAVTIAAQSPSKRQLVLSLSDGGFIAFRSETATTNNESSSTRSLASLINSQAVAGENKIIHRVLTDSNQRVIFGYDLWVKADPLTKRFSLAVLPSDEAFRRTFLKESVSSRLDMTFPTFPKSATPQTLDDGDTVSLELLVNQASGLKIVDLVKVTFDRASLIEQTPENLPRDFTLEAVALSIKGYQLMVDGRLVGQSKSVTGYSGSLLWFYVPNRGRFIFSLVPREGYEFRKVGVLEGNKIEFVANGELYEWFSGSEILPNGGRWNLWVLNDERYTPMFATQKPPPQDKKPGLLSKLEGVLQKGGIDSISVGGLSPSDETTKPRAPDVPARVMVGGADSIEHLIPRGP